MRRFLLGLLIIVLTLAALVGGGMLLARLEPAPEIPPESTQAPAELPAETTQPPETETTEPEETEPKETTPKKTKKKKKTVDTVPRYYQTDYPYIKFGNNTISTSGCSITCLAMVATYLTDTEYTPPQMAHHFGNYGKNNIERLDYGISQMQLPYRRTEDIQDVLQVLKDGKVAILMMDEESVFTTEQHFIVAAGLTEDGKIVVNDPMETNYLNADVAVKNCYENGFDDFYLLRGFSGGWIFDKKDMKKVSFRFDASIPEQKTNRYEGYVLTEEDIYDLACFVWVEAGQEPPEVKQAVVEVVLNRVMSPDYPDTVQAVLKKTELYRAVDKMAKVGETDFPQYIAVDTAMYGPYILPEDVCFYSQWETGVDEWGTLGSYTFYRSRG